MLQRARALSYTTSFILVEIIVKLFAPLNNSGNISNRAYCGKNIVFTFHWVSSSNKIVRFNPTAMLMYLYIFFLMKTRRWDWAVRVTARKGRWLPGAVIVLISSRVKWNRNSRVSSEDFIVWKNHARCIDAPRMITRNRQVRLLAMHFTARWMLLTSFLSTRSAHSCMEEKLSTILLQWWII